MKVLIGVIIGLILTCIVYSLFNSSRSTNDTSVSKSEEQNIIDRYNAAVYNYRGRLSDDERAKAISEYTEIEEAMERYNHDTRNSYSKKLADMQAGLSQNIKGMLLVQAELKQHETPQKSTTNDSYPKCMWCGKDVTGTNYNGYALGEETQYEIEERRQGHMCYFCSKECYMAWVGKNN